MRALDILQRALRRTALLPLAVWQWGISPWLPPSCRYHPSCSAYARTSILRHGLWAGFWLSLFRLARCHPWGASGYDPVPQRLTRPFYVVSQYRRAPRAAARKRP